MGFVDAGQRPVEMLFVSGIESQFIEMLVIGGERAGPGRLGAKAEAEAEHHDADGRAYADSTDRTTHPNQPRT